MATPEHQENAGETQQQFRCTAQTSFNELYCAPAGRGSRTPMQRENSLRSCRRAQTGMERSNEVV